MNTESWLLLLMMLSLGLHNGSLTLKWDSLHIRSLLFSELTKWCQAAFLTLGQQMTEREQKKSTGIVERTPETQMASPPLEMIKHRQKIRTSCESPEQFYICHYHLVTGSLLHETITITALIIYM